MIFHLTKNVKNKHNYYVITPNSSGNFTKTIKVSIKLDKKIRKYKALKKSYPSFKIMDRGLIKQGNV